MTVAQIYSLTVTQVSTVDSMTVPDSTRWNAVLHVRTR